MKYKYWVTYEYHQFDSDRSPQTGLIESEIEITTDFDMEIAIGKEHMIDPDYIFIKKIEKL
jgi:hypothetical protein